MNPQSTRYVLSNGLTVVLKEIHTAPIISQWIWYRVGSRNEKPGLTGLSHWVEHMQFKGTAMFPAGVLDRAISRDGGVWNAFTYLDWTAYFETLPVDKFDLALQLEADRMSASLFEDDMVEAERSVIISERRGSENEPTFQLSEALHAAAFEAHSYRHDIIGSIIDLENIQRDDLYHHYRSYYCPSNAVLTISGDFETESMIQRVRQYYEQIPAGQPPKVQVHPEPAQMEERSVKVEGPGETTYLELGYHVPQANHPDFLALNILDSLLSGASDLSVFGGGLSNKTSRLYRALVEEDLAVSIHGGLQATIDPYLYTLSLIVHPDSDPQLAIDAFDRQIERLQDGLPGMDELERAVKQARALFAYNSESITHQAFWIGLAEMFAGQDWLEGYLEQLAKVTPQDVQRVAQTYLQPQNRTLSAYLPTGEEE
jgi:zinc protease